MDNVFLIDKNFYLTKIGNINTNNNSFKLTYLSDSDSLNKFNRKVLEYIMMDLKHDLEIMDLYPESIYNINDTSVIVVGDIEGLIINFYRYRACTGYLIIQKSPIQTRVLVYACDKILSKATSFSSNIDLLIKDIKSDKNENFVEIRKQINSLLRETCNSSGCLYKKSILKSVPQELIFGI